MGSTLFRSEENPALVVGIARWRSKDDLAAFWEQAGPMQFQGATLEAMEILEELDHLTVEQPVES